MNGFDEPKTSRRDKKRGDPRNIVIKWDAIMASGSRMKSKGYTSPTMR